MRYRSAFVVVTLAFAIASSGCSAPAQPAPAPTASTSASPTPVPAPSASTTPTPSASATPAPKPSATTPPKDTRKGKELNTPFQVNGIQVVSMKHRITAAYRPPHQTGPNGLTAPAAAALAKMTAAARKDGVRIVVRSGYRDWATQNSIYQKALRNYPQNISFYAPAGASEHQIGLSVDLWDGTTWSLPMARSAAGKWLFRHAHAYGFVLRYPDGKSRITGYHYEPWHYRYLGRADAMKFGNNRLTLEEYLGLA